MVPPHFSHKWYVRFVHNRTGRYGGLPTDHRHSQVWRKLKRTSLNPVYPILASLYSPDQGGMACNPVCMFRSCLAMVEYGKKLGDCDNRDKKPEDRCRGGAPIDLAVLVDSRSLTERAVSLASRAQMAMSPE